MPFSAKQQEYLNNATHRWNVKSGATRSGKTFLDYIVIPKRLEKCTGQGLILLLGNTQGTLERNILEPMRNLWPGLVGNISSGSNTVHIFGKKCYALGADKINQVSKIQGAGLEYCYGDEVTTWHEDVFTMLKSRLDKPTSCFDGTCNPDHPKHWFKRFLDSDADIYQQAYRIDDNPFLSPAFVHNLKKEYEGTVYYDRFIEGLWRAAEGVIYRLFANDASKYLVDAISPSDELVMVNIGVDFGGNASASTFEAVGFTRYFRKAIVVDEEFRPAAVEDPETLNTAFVDFCKRVQKKYPRICQDAYCDSAEQILIRGFMKEVAKNKVPIRIHNAVKGTITGRIRLVCSLLGTGRFFVFRHCGHLIGGLENAVWDSKKLDDIRLDDGTYEVDPLDAMEYAIEPVAKQLQLMGV